MTPPRPPIAVAAGPPPAARPAPSVRTAGRWLAAAALAAPLGVVLHEGVHAATAVAVGFEGVALHFASVGYAGHDAFWEAFRSGAPLPLSATGVGLVAASGVVATWALAVAAAVAARRVGLETGWGAVLGATALLAPARAYTGLSYMVAVRPRWPDAFPHFDEFLAARALGTPVDPWVLAGVAVMVGTWVALAPKIGRAGWAAYPALLLGTVLGMLVWLTVGPVVLP